MAEQKAGWPLSGFEHRDYTEDEIIQVIVKLRRGMRLDLNEREYLATMIEQMVKRIEELRTRNDILEAACRKANG